MLGRETVRSVLTRCFTFLGESRGDCVEKHLMLSELSSTAKSGVKTTELQQWMTRARVSDCNLLELSGLRWPLWLRRVLARAQERQWTVQQHRPFSLGEALVRRLDGVPVLVRQTERGFSAVIMTALTP